MPVENEVRGNLGHRLGLIETLRWEPGAGAVRAARHLQRMQASASFLGKPFDHNRAENLLESISSSGTLRLRLLLDADNELSLTSHPYQPLAPDTEWKVKIAGTKASSLDSLLAHKTTERRVYEAARAEFSLAEADEVLLANEHGHLCEGTFTNLFVEKNGRLVTPPLTSGLLRGVLRQELLDTGAAVEGIVVPSDLAGHPFFVGNSLRGLIPARLGR